MVLRCFEGVHGCSFLWSMFYTFGLSFLGLFFWDHWKCLFSRLLEGQNRIYIQLTPIEELPSLTAGDPLGHCWV